MANEPIQFLYGPKENISKIQVGTPGRLFFTVITPDGDGQPEGHIYYDNGTQLVHLYGNDLDNLENKIDTLDAIVKSITGDESTDSIADMIDKAIKKLNINDLYNNKYEFFNLLPGAYVSTNGKEYRIFFKDETPWKKQSNDGSNPNYRSDRYYISMRAYAPSDDVVGFKEATATSITDTKLYGFTAEDFGGIDKYGRKYSIIWLPVAKEEAGDWTYSGDDSTDEKYKGWHYTVEWYDAAGNVVAADQIRINLANERNSITMLPTYLNDYATKKDLEEVEGNGGGVGTWEQF